MQTRFTTGLTSAIAPILLATSLLATSVPAFSAPVHAIATKKAVVKTGVKKPGVRKATRTVVRTGRIAKRPVIGNPVSVEPRRVVSTVTAMPAFAREIAPYAYLDDAEALFDTIGSSPPDYAFRIGQDDDWVWDVSGALLLAEPSGDTRRFYAFAPGDAYPFFIDDGVYRYGFERGALAAIYDRDARLVPWRPDDPIAHAADVLAEHGWLLARSRRERRSVVAGDWVAGLDRNGPLNVARGAADGYHRPDWSERLDRERLSSERARRRDRSDAFGQWRAGGYRGAPPSGLAAGQATTDRADRRGSAVPGGGPTQHDRPRQWPGVAAVGTDPSRAVRSPLEEASRAPTDTAFPSDRNRSPRFGAENGDPQPRHDRTDIDARVAPANAPLGVSPPPRPEPNVGEPARSPDRVAAPVRRHAPSTPEGVSEAAPGAGSDSRPEPGPESRPDPGAAPPLVGPSAPEPVARRRDSVRAPPPEPVTVALPPSSVAVEPPARAPDPVASPAPAPAPAPAPDVPPPPAASSPPPPEQKATDEPTR